MKEIKKEFTNIYFLFGVLILMLMLISTQLLFSTDDIIKKIEQPTPTSLTYLTDFELIELAIIWQESKGNPNPKHSDGKSEGILQITPIYVKECKSNLRKEQIYPPRPQKPAKIARNVPCGTELPQPRKRREKSR